MDRKEFLIISWKKAIKPILLIGVILFCVQFLYAVFTERGPERLVTVLIIELGVLFLTAYLIGQLFRSWIKKIYSHLPESVRPWMSIIGKILNYSSPLLFGILVYFFWKEGWVTAAIVLGIVLIQQIVELVRVD